MRRPVSGCVLLIVSTALAAAPGEADEFVLRSGGRVRGTWVNHDERPLRRYVVHTEQGGQLTIDVSQVAIALRQSPAEAEYERLAPSCPDTVPEHWRLAQWCREQRLDRQQDFHLGRILDLDPQCVQAWHALGYSQVGGEWTTRRKAMRDRGYVLHDGTWRLPQDIEILEQRKRNAEAEAEWFTKLRRWRSQLLSDRAPEASLRTMSIRDPQAVRALASFLLREPHRRVKLLYIEALGEIDDRRALSVLVAAALNDPDDEVFYASLDKIAARKSPDLVKYFARTLKDGNNLRVNRAAQVLGRLGDGAAIPPLIDALVTTHAFVLPGSDTMVFGVERESSTPTTGGAGNALPASPGTMGMRGPHGPKVIPYQVANRSVLDALVQLSGGVSLGFDKTAWGYWLTLQQQQNRPDLQARRD